MVITRWRTHFEPDALVLAGYPFPRGGRPSRVPASSLSEVCVGWAPPTVRTHEGEYLFVPATQARDLADFASRNALPFLRREDLWSFILDEFLDTEFSAEAQEGSLRFLAERGVSRQRTHELRALVGRRMLYLTLATWEWMSYGLYDVLGAMRPFTFTTGWSFPRFYAESMRIAEQGGTRPSSREDFLGSFGLPSGPDHG